MAWCVCAAGAGAGDDIRTVSCTGLGAMVVNAAVAAAFDAGTALGAGTFASCMRAAEIRVAMFTPFCDPSRASAAFEITLGFAEKRKHRQGMVGPSQTPLLMPIPLIRPTARNYLCDENIWPRRLSLHPALFSMVVPLVV